MRLGIGRCKIIMFFVMMLGILECAPAI
jgi:hypothetical protein